MTSLHSRKSINRSPLRLGFRSGALALVLACCSLPPASRALLPPPPPDGGYPVRNTAEGNDALLNLAGGTDNTAVGFSALYSNTMGDNNTANGSSALLANTMGNNNTAIGYEALQRNATGGQNTAIGVSALENNVMGGRNTAVGRDALYRSTGSDNIALGVAAGSYLMNGSNNIDIGNPGGASETGRIRIGIEGRHTGAFIAGIYNVAVPGSPVVVNSIGRLGVMTSSSRFKETIKPMDKASEAILALKPVTFHYKKEVDPDGIPQFGLVAEQVEKVNPDLVARDEEGKVYTVRYEAVNAMLLNEFLKEHRKNEEQEKTIVELKSGMTALAATVKEQAAQIQKVRAQLEANKSAVQVVNNP
jgi:hypothetical protein